jgi:hypothetical protein
MYVLLESNSNFGAWLLSNHRTNESTFGRALFASISTRCCLQILATEYFRSCDIAASCNHFLLDARIERVHPPVYWQSLSKNVQETRIKTTSKQPSKTKNNDDYSDACHYTTIVYRQATDRIYHIYVDFEHYNLCHHSWKQSIEHDDSQQQTHSLASSLSNRTHQQQQQQQQHMIAMKHLQWQELVRYYRTHRANSDRQRLNRLTTLLAARSRERYHMNYFPASCFQQFNVDSNVKRFFHRKYLVCNCCRQIIHPWITIIDRSISYHDVFMSTQCMISFNTLSMLGSTWKLSGIFF